MSEPFAYQITPSQLNGFQRFVDAETTADERWNLNEDGSYKVSPADMARIAEVDLINSINRCPRLPAEAADRGTALNEIVDRLVAGRPSNPAVSVTSLETGGDVYAYRAELNGFVFDFDASLVLDLAMAYAGSLCQYLVSAPIETAAGLVRLYGYIDYWPGGTIVDLKTTTSFSFGKYGRGWQHLVYPYAAIESGRTKCVTQFIYDVVELHRRGGFYYGNRYAESYDYHHAEATDKLRGGVERFITWLEARRAYITDRKIFGGENPDGYVGTPITVEQLFKND